MTMIDIDLIDQCAVRAPLETNLWQIHSLNQWFDRDGGEECLSRPDAELLAIRAGVCLNLMPVISGSKCCLT